MRRTATEKLLAWKQAKSRKPLLIDGARQSGKTYLLKNLLGATFDQVVHLDFLENPSLTDAFTDSLNPENVLSALELITGETLEGDNTLVIFDEIGECPRAVTSLKYFAEKAPHRYIAASGSNIGLLGSFPVGKVEQLVLRPLSFQEFLLASEDTALIKVYEEGVDSTAAHSKLLDHLTDYFFTGGMPEAVDTWYTYKGKSINERVSAVSRVQSNLVTGYAIDFGKYSGKTDANMIEAIFRSIPSQLSSVQNESVNRFKFKNVYQKKSRYSELESGITWLAKCRLALRNYPLEGTPRSPLAAQHKDSRVKLFLHDVGLLCHMLGLSYLEIKQQAFEYKGFVAENFVAQELAVAGLDPTYSWNDARAEIEFVASDDQGHIVPLEVKSGVRTRSKSLQSYREKCSPAKTIKLTGTRGSPATERSNLVYPLYFTRHAVRDHKLH